VNKNKVQKESDTLEPSKQYKIIFSLYVAIGFLVLVLIPSIFNPMTYKALPDALRIKLSQPWGSPYVQGHPRLGLWVGFVAIPLFFLIFFNPFRKASRRGFYILIIFTLFVCISAYLSFGPDIAYAIWGISFAFLMAMIDHFKLKKFDMTQLSDPSIEMWARIEKIKGINDYWNTCQWGSFILWGILFVIGFLVIANLPNLYSGSQYARIPMYAIIINIIYPSLGIGQGTILEHKKENNELMDKIKTPIQQISTQNEQSASSLEKKLILQKHQNENMQLEVLTDDGEKSYEDIPILEQNKSKFIIWMDEKKGESFIYGQTVNLTKTTKKVLIKLLEKCEEIVYFRELGGRDPSGTYDGSTDIRKEVQQRIKNIHHQTHKKLRKNIIAVKGQGYKFQKTNPEFNFCIIYPTDLTHYKKLK
jgi:hypothetical protein